MRARLTAEITLDGRVLFSQGGDHIELATANEIAFVCQVLEMLQRGLPGNYVYLDGTESERSCTSDEG
jgi:hypothetical protein